MLFTRKIEDNEVKTVQDDRGKKYKCDKCDAAYKSRTHLHEHKNSISYKKGRKNYCEHCPYVSCSPNMMKKHCKEIHGIDEKENNAKVKVLDTITLDNSGDKNGLKTLPNVSPAILRRLPTVTQVTSAAPVTPISIQHDASATSSGKVTYCPFRKFLQCSSSNLSFFLYFQFNFKPLRRKLLLKILSN